MDRRLIQSSFFASIIAIALLTTRFAAGASNDAAVQKLRDQAIDQDYLATNYAAAEKKLTDALLLCKRTSDCSPFIRGRVHCDLGVVEYMLHKVDLARTEFATALLEDPNVDLDKDLANTDVQKEFAAAKGGGPPPPSAPSPAPPPPASSAPAGPDQNAPAAAGATQGGGVSHVPPTQGQVRTPLPLYAEVAPDLGAAKVVVRYKPVGLTEWKTAAMDKMGNGYGGEIPCTDVGNREGELLYFIQAMDTSGDLVASNGRSVTPHSVDIVKKLDGEAPHLPGKPPPAACKPSNASAASASSSATSGETEASDCPPGFPGCHTESEPTSCESKDDCMAGEDCIDRVCKKGDGEDENRQFKKNWLSLSVQADLLLMPGANAACAGGVGYSCFVSDTYYADIPTANVDDEVLGGFATSPMIRILLGYDRVVGPHLEVGGRLGYAVFGGGPQRLASNGNDAGPNFMPIHVEARIAYWFGKNVFARKGPRFYLFGAGGLSEVDASQNIDVVPQGTHTALFVDAWRKTGLGFVAAGPGMMYAVTPNGGFTLELKPELLFPTFGISVGGAIGYTIGL